VPPSLSGVRLNQSTLPVGSTTAWMASDGTRVGSLHRPTSPASAAASERRAAPAEAGGAPAEAGHASQLAAR
jgi:hypothetical protein